MLYVDDGIGIKQIAYLEPLEMLRWKAFLSLNHIFEGPWKNIFNEVIKERAIFGVQEDGNKKLICCENGYSYSEDIVSPDTCSADKFVRCLEENEIPLYTTSPLDDIKEAVKNLIDGNLFKIKRDDAWLKKFNRLDNLMMKRRHIMGKILHVISMHMSTIASIECRKHPNNPYLHDRLIINLKLNGRSYLYRNNSFICLPEQKEDGMVTHTIDSYQEDYNRIMKGND